MFCDSNFSEQTLIGGGGNDGAIPEVVGQDW